MAEIFDLNKIKQLLPAEGWWECRTNFDDETKSYPWSFRRLIAWALVEGTYRESGRREERMVGLVQQEFDPRNEGSGISIIYEERKFGQDPSYVRDEDFEVLGKKLRGERDPTLFG